eukprot:6175588-Pleurochrysis_carterae.AAC.1
MAEALSICLVRVDHLDVTSASVTDSVESAAPPALINSAAAEGLQRPRAALLRRASLGCGPRGDFAL